MMRHLAAQNAKQWQLLNAPDKRNWELAARRASLCMHGYDLWQHYCMTHDNSAIRTLEHQTDTNLLWTSGYPRVISIRADASIYYVFRLRAFTGRAAAAHPSNQTGPVTYRTQVLLGMLPLIPGMCKPFVTALVHYTIVLNAATKTLIYVAAIEGPNHNCGTGVRYLDFEPGQHITYGENAPCNCEYNCNITTWFRI